MDNLNDFKAIWNTAQLDGLPDSAEMERVIKKYRNKKLIKLIFIILAALFLVILVFVTAFITPSKLVSTKIGESLIVAGGLVLMATNLNSLYRFYHLKVCSNKEYIAFLEQTQIRQLFYFKRTQVVAMMLLLTGMMFYLFEKMENHPKEGLVIYSAMIIYFLVMWFVIRPKAYKRGAMKLNEELENARRIAKQFQENEE